MSVRFYQFVILLLVAGLFHSCDRTNPGKPRVLVFSKTAGFHHESIPAGIAAIQKLGSINGFEVDTSTNSSRFTDDSLKIYAAIIFLSTTGDILDYRQEDAFERYIQAGGGYLGIHAAADAEYDWNWYGKLVGGYFLDHPGIHDSFPNVQEGVFLVSDPGESATKHLEKEWKRKDEFYSYKKLNPDVKVLLTIDENSYHGGHRMGIHPMAWYHAYDGGRAFYIEPGHTAESFEEENYLKLLLAGIQYTMDGNKVLDYSKCKTGLPPDEDRFVKTQLSMGEFFEPTEMTILPNLDILIIQRRGEVLLYKNQTKKIKQVGYLDVYYKAKAPGVNVEEGMLGLARDPDFERNHWVYIYYSPADSSVNRLSRFVFRNDTIDKSTEKTILEVKADREICCHTGGSIAFGPDKLLYFSSGDNSTPFDEPGARFVNSGYAPLNDYSQHRQYDARRSSGNTNDLRGKILRIKVNDDGSYEIPDGNLFPKGIARTRPEIYVMGNRNPYRISVDQKNSWLYWGEVGPDANIDSFETRGPKGYDEVNQARKSGYFGWPLFVGDNYPYRSFDYGTGKSGLAFDPQHPINDSKHNTGLRELPPAQPAFIWYPYGPSPDFPQVGVGGRNAMAGPVYYTDLYPEDTRLPDYYNGKLIIYDWVRGWVKAVSMFPNGDYNKMEPFFPSLKLNSLIDMEVGPDGKLYLLEYGNGWFSKNPDAGLARIDYIAGNRPPAISKIDLDKTSGVLPMSVQAKIQARDPEGGHLTYLWDFGNGITRESRDPSISYTYTKAGDYNISVTVKDDRGATVKSESASLYAGNEAPRVELKFTSGNRSFYLPGKPLGYTVTVTDETDTAKFDQANLFVSVDYPEGYDKASSPQGHQQGQPMAGGKSLMLSLDCKTCHKETEKSIGPSFFQVSEKYQKDLNASGYLSQKIIKGGGGVWGEVAMAAHPTLTQEDVGQIVSWILSLGNKEMQRKSLPPSGTIIPPLNTKQEATLVLSASYTDKGGNNIKALTGSNSIILKNSSVGFSGNETVEGFTRFTYNEIHGLVYPKGTGWFGLGPYDLSGVGSVDLITAWQVLPASGFTFEARLDSKEGNVIGRGSMPVPRAGQKSGIVHIPIEPVNDGAMHTIYFIYKADAHPAEGYLIRVHFNAR